MATELAFRSSAVRHLATIFVNRIPWTATANEVKEHFSQFGTIRRCFLPFVSVSYFLDSLPEQTGSPETEKETGFHKGFCWIGFSSEEELERALQQENHFIDGVKVDVQRQRYRH